jgi:hypothetical protein
MADLESAQRQLVNEHLNWATLENRLRRFPAIARAFPLDRLRSSAESPPYYCHYMAWRLGTWNDEALFTRLNELLGVAEALPNWSAQGALLTSADFAEFWSLVWQLQVAEYLWGLGTDVSWGASGPDLAVEVEGERWFIECYAYRKSYGLMLFIEDVLRRVDGSIRVEYDLCLPFGLPTDGERSGFLDAILSPFRNPGFVADARAKSAHDYPVILCQHDSGLVVYVKGSDPDAYVPGRVGSQTGDPQRYLEVAVNEALRAKQNANSLATHRPNLLVANYALSTDFQLALCRADDLGLALPTMEPGGNIDALAISAVGIDARLTRSGLRRVAPLVSDSTALNRMTCAT